MRSIFIFFLLFFFHNVCFANYPYQFQSTDARSLGAGGQGSGFSYSINSSMFLNPATLGQFGGLNFDLSFAYAYQYHINKQFQDTEYMLAGNFGISYEVTEIVNVGTLLTIPINNKRVEIDGNYSDVSSLYIIPVVTLDFDFIHFGIGFPIKGFKALFYTKAGRKNEYTASIFYSNIGLLFEINDIVNIGGFFNFPLFTPSRIPKTFDFYEESTKSYRNTIFNLCEFGLGIAGRFLDDTYVIGFDWKSGLSETLEEYLVDPYKFQYDLLSHTIGMNFHVNADFPFKFYLGYNYVVRQMQYDYFYFPSHYISGGFTFEWSPMISTAVAMQYSFTIKKNTTTWDLRLEIDTVFTMLE